MGNRKSIERKREEGCGIIDLMHPETYKPWIHTREVRSGSGKRHMIPDLVYPERMIYLMSNLEKDVYYFLRRNLQVEELFEQVLLELEDTIKICEELEIRHPHRPYSGEHIVMTTDFVAYVKKESGYEFQAFAVKPEKELNDQRVLEKLKVEQQYWMQRGIAWAVITEAVFK